MKNLRPFIDRPILSAAPDYYHYYFQLTNEDSYLETALQNQLSNFELFINSIPSEKENYSYAEGKWSVKGVVAHCVETERILQYRALRFSRFDSTEISGFDENWYTKHNNHEALSLSDLMEEFTCVRKATLLLYQNMTLQMLDFVGIANQKPNTARNIGWFIVGHLIHHTKVIKQRYL